MSVLNYFFLYLSIYLSIHPSIYLFTYLFIYLSILSTYLFYLSIYLSTYLFIYLYISLLKHRHITTQSLLSNRFEFCGLDQAFPSGTVRRLEWRAGCPQPSLSSTASLLGSLINFDVEDTLSNNLYAVNSGLTSLGNGQLLSNLATSADQAARELMEGARRRMDVRGWRRKGVGLNKDWKPLVRLWWSRLRGRGRKEIKGVRERNE